jgi:hypothetical protein
MYVGCIAVLYRCRSIHRTYLLILQYMLPHTLFNFFEYPHEIYGFCVKLEGLKGRSPKKIKLHRDPITTAGVGPKTHA